MPSSATPSAPPLVSLLAEFDSPGALVTAAERVRDAGYRRWDTHSPFPVHGIDEAMGIRRTRLPWLVFLFGVVGCAAGLGLQWWTNAASAADFRWVPTFLQGYDFLISGKPTFSLPANIPVVFEVTVLLAALAAVIGMFAMNNLPKHSNPLLATPGFKRVTADRFFLRIDADDPKFDERQTAQFLADLGGSAVERVQDNRGSRRLPGGFVIALWVIVGLALLPPLFVAKARLTTSEKPRIHPIQDMANQERFKAQQAHPLFADGREMRPPVAGTLARGDLHDDPHFYEGKVNGQWATTFPAQIEITEAFVRRGQQRFNIYCAPCHGLGGAGDGIISQRAVQLDEGGWVPPTVLVDQPVRDREHGYLFNTITKGIRTMPPYGDQIPPEDRWAIVAYVRALQLSQHAKLEDVPPDVRPEGC